MLGRLLTYLILKSHQNVAILFLLTADVQKSFLLNTPVSWLFIFACHLSSNPLIFRAVQIETDVFVEGCSTHTVYGSMSMLPGASRTRSHSRKVEASAHV